MFASARYGQSVYNPQHRRTFDQLAKGSKAPNTVLSRVADIIVTRLTMRALSFAFLIALLTAVDASAESVQLASIPIPIPFPQGASVFQWDYQCTERKVCGFTGFGLERLSLQSASIVLAKIKVGEVDIPTYFIWCTLADGSLVSAVAQDEISFRFSVVNMKLIAAGAPGL
jgi:hypothetical protein